MYYVVLKWIMVVLMLGFQIILGFQVQSIAFRFYLIRQIFQKENRYLLKSQGISIAMEINAILLSD